MDRKGEENMLEILNLLCMAKDMLAVGILCQNCYSCTSFSTSCTTVSKTICQKLFKILFIVQVFLYIVQYLFIVPKMFLNSSITI